MTVLELLQQQGIDCHEHGPNVRKGQVAIRCPWCGDADPSQHMNVDPKTGAFSCFRNSQHRGRRPHGLLMKLLGCSHEAVQALLTDTSDLRRTVQRLTQEEASEEPVEEERLHGRDAVGLVPLTSRGLSYFRFRDYLAERGFDHEQLPIMSELYDLRCALTGRFKFRVVFPVHDVGGKIIGYTGRCIDDGSLRYLSLPGTTVKRHLLWENLLAAGGRTLRICEGPLDALKVDYVGRVRGSPDRATCTFGVNPSRSQLARIVELADGFQRLAILFDGDALGAAIRLQNALMPMVDATIERLPDGVADPGELLWGQVIRMTR